MKCPICHKPLKENTEGNNKYCQGHSILESRTNYSAKQRQKAEEEGQNY